MLPPHLAPPYPILLEDGVLLVAHKPAGVEDGAGSSGESEGFWRSLEEQTEKNLQPLYRLDKGASGAISYLLKEITQNPQVIISYLALVRGWLDDKGKIPDPDGGEELWSNEFHTLGRYELPFAVGRYSQVRLSLLKIRSIPLALRKLRRSLRLISHPLIGDSNYGDSRQNQFFHSWSSTNRLFLFSHQIHLSIPEQGIDHIIQADLFPQDQRVLEKLKPHRVL